ncbi:MAG: DUF427 domain-containing protein [Nocardioides sp.]
MPAVTRRPVPDPIEPGQESVWDYPRPPRVEPSGADIEVHLGGIRIARTDRSWRVLETSHPPTYYLPRDAFLDGALRPASGETWCEWKGRAAYFDVIGGQLRAARAAWTYPEPTPAFQAIADAVAVMPAAMDHCAIDGEIVVPQPGTFYGGWITSRVAGPFKGIPGSSGW